MSVWKKLKERIQAEAEKEESLKESLNKLEETFKRKEKKDEIPLEVWTSFLDVIFFLVRFWKISSFLTNSENLGIGTELYNHTLYFKLPHF